MLIDVAPRNILLRLGNAILICNVLHVHVCVSVSFFLFFFFAFVAARKLVGPLQILGQLCNYIWILWLLELVAVQMGYV